MFDSVLMLSLFDVENCNVSCKMSLRVGGGYSAIHRE